MPREQGRKLVAQNKKARHDYSIEDVYEAGMVLTGTEVKSLRAGRASLVDGYATLDDGEIWLRGVHIPEYTQGTWTNHEPRRPRKLLLNRTEVNRIANRLRESGLTLVPLALYFQDGYAKVEIAVARGRKSYDKRHAIAERESKRETDRALGQEQGHRLAPGRLGRVPDRLDLAGQRHGIERLGDDVDGPEGLEVLDLVGLHLCGDEDDWHVGEFRSRAEVLQCRGAIHSWHHHVQQDQVGDAAVDGDRASRPDPATVTSKPPTSSSAIVTTSWMSGSSST